MDREIKFKVWDNLYKKFCPINIDCYRITFQGDVWLISCSQSYDKTCWPFARLDSDRFKMLQFTGLLDKNGREIFEGDIIQEEWNDWEGNPLESKYIIKFGEYENGDGFPEIGFYTDFILNRDKNYIGLICGGNIYTCKKENRRKIIGNIFENPELLNKIC